MGLRWVAGTLRVAAHNLDLVRLDGVRVVELERDVLDNERPNLIAETVRVEMALERGGLLAVAPNVHY